MQLFSTDQINKRPEPVGGKTLTQTEIAASNETTIARSFTYSGVPGPSHPRHGAAKNGNTSAATANFLFK